jgi:phosphate transport system permease protein
MPQQQHANAKRSHGWMGIHRGHQARPLERLAEWGILGVSFSTIAVIFLIFIFVGKEAWPLVTGRVSSAAVKDVIPAQEIETRPIADLFAYLEISDADARDKIRQLAAGLATELRETPAGELPAKLKTGPDVVRERLLAAFPADFDRAATRLSTTVPNLNAQSIPALRELVGVQLRDWLQTLMEIRQEALSEIPASVKSDPDARVNTTRWRYLLKPHQWADYDKPEYIWQPIGNIHKYNIVPLVVGTLKTTLIGLLFAVPLALGAAIYVSQLARPRMKEWIKPGIELLSGIPSVVMGTFALIVMATFLQKLFGYQVRLNAFVAGIALGLAVIPLVFSIAEDALTSVPRTYTQAALALGASKWQAAYQVVLPSALPGVFAAIVLGFGRAIGETMIVLLVCSASVMSWDIFDSARSITATIAAEMAEAVSGGHHYRILFLLGALLFAVTFVTNLIGDFVMHHYKAKLEGKRA